MKTLHSTALSLAIGLICANSFADPFEFTVLHTNDLHSHFDGQGPTAHFTPMTGDNDLVDGHYARLARTIERIREEKANQGEPTLLLDGGDFFSGSLFHALGPLTSTLLSPEVEFFQALKYDGATLGNHEFDAGESGLANLLAKKAWPGVIASNMSCDQPPSLKQLPEFKVVEIKHHGKTLRIGLLGVVGWDAAKLSAGNRSQCHFIGFDDVRFKAYPNKLIQFLNKRVKILRDTERVDLVIILLHGGGTPASSDGEDEQLIKIDGVDIVIAGHSHQVYTKQIGTGWITQAGSYGRYLGKLEFSYSGGNLTLRNPGKTHIKIDDSQPSSTYWLKRIAEYRKEINARIKHWNLQFETPVVTISKSMKRSFQAHDPLGIRLTSAIRNQLKIVSKPVDVYFTALSLIRENFETAGKNPAQYQFADIFRILSNGFAPTFEPVSPIVDFYLTQNDFVRLVKFLDLYRRYSPAFTPTYSDSFQFEIRSWGIPFINRIHSLALHGKPQSEWPQYIHLATNAYVAAFFDKLPKMSYNLLRIEPRNQDGTPLHLPLKPANLEGEAVLLSRYLQTHPFTQSD